MTPLNSSNLAAVGYGGGILMVAFRSGSVYAYVGVPWNRYVGLMNASIHGSYFHRYISTSYPYQRIV